MLPPLFLYLEDVMAAYAASVSATMKNAEQIGNGPFGIFVGKVNVTNYNQTNAAITALSKKFRTVLHVIAGVTDTGYVLFWTGTSFKAYTFEDTSNVPVEVASDIDVGEASFVAFGLI